MRHPRRARQVLTGVIGLAALAVAIVAGGMLRHYRPRYLIRRVISEPTVHLEREEFWQLESYLDTHDIKSAEERKAFCQAVVERAGANMNDILWLVVLPAWKENGRFDEIWDASEAWIRGEKPGSQSLLNWLASADRPRARSLVDYQSVLEQCEDEGLIVASLDLMDESLIESHRRSLEALLSRSDVSDCVKNIAASVVSGARGK